MEGMPTREILVTDRGGSRVNETTESEEDQILNGVNRIRFDENEEKPATINYVEELTKRDLKDNLLFTGNGKL